MRLTYHWAHYCTESKSGADTGFRKRWGASNSG